MLKNCLVSTDSTTLLGMTAVIDLNSLELYLTKFEFNVQYCPTRTDAHLYLGIPLQYSLKRPRKISRHETSSASERQHTI